MESRLKAEEQPLEILGRSYEIIQLLVCGHDRRVVTGFYAFDRLRSSHISHSTYERPLPIPLQSDSAAGALSDGAEVPGKWHIYPEMISEGSFIANRAIALPAVRCA